MQKYVSPKLSQELVNSVTESFGLNQSLYQQYISFCENIFKGELGISYTHRMEVSKVISHYFPFTATFALIVFLLEFLLAIFLAKFLYHKNNESLDKFVQKLGMGFYCFPSFVVALFLIYIFSIKLNLLPSSDLKSLDYDKMTLMGKTADYIKHMVLPVLTLLLSGFFVLFIYLHEKVKEISNKDFILKSRAEGKTESVIFWRHIFPNAVGPFLTISGIEVGILLSGTLITEVIFSLPGMGRLTVEAMLSRDYPLIVGITLLSGSLIIAANLITDLIRAFIDKRTIREFVN